MKKVLPILLCLCLVGCSTTTEETTSATTTPSETPTAQTTETSETVEATTEETTEETTTIPTTSYTGSTEYELVFEDDFDGDELNTDNWNYEQHNPGWVNNELQFYYASEDNIYVENGDLVIQPLKVVDESGNIEYSSGRINSWLKQDFLYGKVEARIKVPHGDGFLPAFWMMPTLNSHYGNWPRCGEIDIMEIVTNNPTTCYGGIHYGNSHRQNQGSMTLTDGNFADEYHVFTLEWEPGRITWYVDDIEMYTTDDWYCKSEGGKLTPYPAPFDQQFYIIFNVAVGGDWPGDPTDSTVFDESAQMRVDYVRVYQRPWYDENVTAPVDYDGVAG